MNTIKDNLKVSFKFVEKANSLLVVGGPDIFGDVEIERFDHGIVDLFGRQREKAQDSSS